MNVFYKWSCQNILEQNFSDIYHCDIAIDI